MEQLKEEGNAAFKAGNFADAVAKYTAAIVSPGGETAVLYSNRSAAHLRSGDAAAALADGLRSAEIDPSYPKAYLRQSKALRALGRPAHAEQALRDGMKKLPGDAILQTGLKEFFIEEDGDQSVLRGVFPGTPGQNMRDFQGEQGMRMHLPQAHAELGSDALRAAYFGSLQVFKDNFDPVKHSNVRAWGVKLPLTSLIVAGAQRNKLAFSNQDPDHAKILEMVLKNGWCRVDAKDVAGFTALQHAAGHHPRLELAKILLKYKANPSTVNRLGDAPITSALMAQEIECVRLLLDAGANPRHVDLTGVLSTERLAQTTHPAALALVHKAMNKHQENKDIAPGSAACGGCGKVGAKKRCTECMSVVYCNRDCQKKHWKIHKHACKKGKASAGAGGGADGEAGGSDGKILRCRFIEPPGTCSTTIPISAFTAQMAQATGMRGGPASSSEDFSQYIHRHGENDLAEHNSKNIIVKIQVPVNPGAYTAFGKDPDLLVYNKERNVHGTIAYSSPQGTELDTIIRKKGISKLKGYFLARVEGNELCVYADKMMPTQDW